MKHFMLPRSPVLKENEQPQPQSQPTSSPNPKSKPPRRSKSSKENAPPTDLLMDHKPSPAVKMRSLLPPRPPPSNPLKRKLTMETAAIDNTVPVTSDSGVKVVVRMRPPNTNEEGDQIVQKLSSESLKINGHTFTFDSVADTEATQQDIYELIGAPLVENCLAGFNSSVFAYGQTGSGKTYTMWGPSSTLLEDKSLSDDTGLTPRVLERLFARISEEHIKHAGKQLKYQCHCSFLEIYNEQITDLLDPNQRNLQIREDVKSGVYVENLSKEYVCTMKDVTQLLIKGLSNRRTGSTSINAESSRSHSVFTCVVESRCKSVADGISSFRTSRINLVDLAGSERQKSTGAAGERLKEAGNINRSLSQLGNLINILAEVSQTGKERHIPYRDSRLTFLLQESLGGNAKLAMVCAISPSQSCRSETFSTLRFAQRAKAIQNKAIVNEVMQDDVNILREVIRQLRDELKRMKENGNNPAGSSGAYTTTWNARQSLNLLKSFGLNHPRTLPQIDDDGDTEMEIDEEAIENLCIQINLQSSETTDANMEEAAAGVENRELLITDCAEPRSCSRDYTTSKTDKDSFIEYCEENKPLPHSVSEDVRNVTVENSASCPASNLTDEVSKSISVVDALLDPRDDLTNCLSPTMSVVPSQISPTLRSPTPSVSPRVKDSRKSLRTSIVLTPSQKDLKDDISQAVPSSSANSNTQKSKCSVQPTESLAASLLRGIDIIRQSSTVRRSSFRFSLKPADSKPSFLTCKVDVGVQTCPEEPLVAEEPSIILCSNCKTKTQFDVSEGNDSSNLQLVQRDGSESAEKSKQQIPKAVEKVLAGSIRREMALEEFCAKQTSEIMQLNRLVQQYKHERECTAIIGQLREDKIIRLENLMDGVLHKEEFMDEENAALVHENKLLKEKYDNHPEILRTNIELISIQDELERYRNFYDMGEREVLLEENQDLKNHLQSYIDSSSTSARRRKSLLKLTYSCEANMAPPFRTIQETEETAVETLEQERIRWTEAESKWFSLAEEMRMDLEKQRRELDTEKKCAEELKEAMQMAMEGHARMLEQYADLEEKHIQLLARHRRIQEGIEDVKKAAARAGVRGAESRFINMLAAENSALKVEREKERLYFKDENKGLKAQLRETAEAVQAAGELLVRLKEAEEALDAAQNRARIAEQEVAKLKSRHDTEMIALKQLVGESRLPKEAIFCHDDHNLPKYDAEESHSAQEWKVGFEPYNDDRDNELLKSSWFSGHDTCNI